MVVVGGGGGGEEEGVCDVIVGRRTEKKGREGEGEVQQIVFPFRMCNFFHFFHFFILCIIICMSLYNND